MSDKTDPYHGLGDDGNASSWARNTQIVRRRTHRGADKGSGAGAAPITDPGLWFMRGQFMKMKAFEIFRNHP